MTNGKLLAAFATLAASAFASPVFSAADLPQRYIIEMQIYDDGAVVAEPRLVVEAGEAAVFVLKGTTRLNYDIEITPRVGSESTVSFQSKIKVTSAGTESHLAEPALTVELGQKATIEFGEKSQTQSPFKMDIRFTAVG